MTGTPLTLTDRTGIVVFEGTSSGGGSVPVIADYSGDPVTVNNNDQQPLTWDTFNAGTELFDRTDPAAPVALAAGTYLVQIAITWANPITAGGYGLAWISSSGAISPPGSSGPLQLDPSSQTNAGYLSTFMVLAAGDTITATIFNIDGMNANDFSLAEAQVLKIA